MVSDGGVSPTLIPPVRCFTAEMESTQCSPDVSFSDSLSDGPRVLNESMLNNEVDELWKASQL